MLLFMLLFMFLFMFHISIHVTIHVSILQINNLIVAGILFFGDTALDIIKNTLTLDATIYRLLYYD